MITNFANLGGGGGGGYVLPVASQSTLGGVKVGEGLSIDSGGTLTAEGGVVQYDLDAMTQSERAEFVAMCENLTELEREELFVYRDKSICRYDHSEGSGNSYKIGFSDYRQDGWSYPLTYFRHFFVKANGTYENLGNSSYPNIITYDTTYSDTAHTLSNSNGLSPLAPVSNLGPGDAKMAINLRLLIGNNQTVLSSKAWSERTGSLEGKIGAEWHYSGNVITAVWSVVENTATISSWTEVPEGGSAGGPKLYILNEMTQAERKDLYDEIVPYGLNSGYNGVSSAFTANDYAFYVYLGNGHNWDIGDQYNGTVQMYVDYIHPDDYGGAVFFTGIVGSRQSSGDAAKKIRFIIDYQGNIDKDTVTIGAPDVSPFGFSYPDNGRLAYDVVNQKFVFINWYDPYSWIRDVDTTGVTESIINNDWVDAFYDKGMFYASDRNAYATPNLAMTIVSGASVEIYAFPSIYVETLTPSIDVDGYRFYKKYYFTYTKKDGSRFIVSMLLNNESRGAQLTYSSV